MRKFLPMVIPVLLLTSCSNKSENTFLNTYENNKAYHKELVKTESTELENGVTSRGVFTATYLYTPSEEKNDTRDEKFIVNLYFNDEEVSYAEDDFNLTLMASLPQKKNGKKKTEKKKKTKEELEKEEKKKREQIRFVKTVKKLDANDPLLKKISLVSEWSQYYLVTFPHMKSKRFYLMFDSAFYGQGHLQFSKVAKFVYDKEVF